METREIVLKQRVEGTTKVAFINQKGEPDVRFMKYDYPKGTVQTVPAHLANRLVEQLGYAEYND